ncbi:NADPH:quinone reductase [Streptoalloteichus tenebrarius]|uniref:NADPH:quinone reductase n=1 Tax=Streptoalloteichus tenebrarius (strain ATCC 17920 / DSM 40477 / JCM 4838 / CBS 697.72 / NBRC 16177 / NCIMB 11028 / NRRL B-12390 / A12253. 1 / ISP 5477) TaxID=1933 RepID=A0ABT1HPJ2_STRSD|nr:NADPH:quinone reductase [Streptoalloteichus tenebrarius]BFE98386.1 zinc-binding dehydrogenase [Streptoalloteichus tenebrarius]
MIDPRGAFQLEQRPEPVAGPGAVVVRVRGAGLNAADLQQARGDYPAPPGWPADVPGLEVAGEVEQVGPGVVGVAPGDRVMALVGGGGHAERITVPADLLLAVPEGLSWEEAAGFPEAFSTAWDGLVTQVGVRAGDRVLITGAAGGVGTAMVQVAAVSGAHVVASVRRPELHDLVTGLVPDGRVDVVTPDQEAAHAPYDVIVELVGGEDCLERVALLRSRGKVLVVGVQAGTTAPLRMFDLMLARAQVIGTTIRGRSHAEKAVLAAIVRRSVVPLLAQGRLRVPVDAAFPLDRFAEAYARLAGPGKFGKVIMLPRLSGRARDCGARSCRCPQARVEARTTTCAWHSPASTASSAGSRVEPPVAT